MGYSRRDVSAMQREVAPAIYGKLDLDKMPERFRTAIDSPLSGMARAVAALAEKKQAEAA